MKAAWLFLLVAALVINVEQNDLQKAKLSSWQTTKGYVSGIVPIPYYEWLVRLLAEDPKTDSRVESGRTEIVEMCKALGKPPFRLMKGSNFSKCFSGIMNLMLYSKESAKRYAKCFHRIDLQEATLLVAGLVDKGLEEIAIDILKRSVGCKRTKSYVMNLILKNEIFIEDYLVYGLIHKDEKIVSLKNGWMERRLETQYFNLMIANDWGFGKTSFFYFRYPSPWQLAATRRSNFCHSLALLSMCLA